MRSEHEDATPQQHHRGRVVGSRGGSVDRVGALDASMLYVETQKSAMHVGSVMVFAATGGEPLGYDRLLEIVASRIPYAPRYRQKLRAVPAGLAAPVWVTDADLDLTYHVRRAALPRPGSDVQLQEFVARVQARPLDRSRPLWEVYLVEGLEHDRFAIVTKAHQALVDGVHAVDIAQVILDDADHDRGRPAPWSPGHEPSEAELLTGALLGAVRSPGRLVAALQGGLGEIRSTAAQVTQTATEVVGAIVRTAARPTAATPLATTTGQARRFVMVGVDLDEVRAVRRAHASGDEVSVNDVILTMVTGALRTWLQARGEPVSRSATVRALVPVSVTDVTGNPGRDVRACFVDLPVGEPNPAMRLVQVAYHMRRQLEGGRAVPAQGLSELAGFAAPTLHALGSRLSSAVTRRMFSLVVTNAPGPRGPIAVDGHVMVSAFPVVPIVEGQALSVGVSSYDGGLFFGINADRDAMPDVDVLGAALVEALSDLRERA